MLVITPALAIAENELDEKFVAASGPGGQNVNKVATSVQLRFDVTHSPALPEGVRSRLLQLAGLHAAHAAHAAHATTALRKKVSLPASDHRVVQLTPASCLQSHTCSAACI